MGIVYTAQDDCKTRENIGKNRGGSDQFPVMSRGRICSAKQEEKQRPSGTFEKKDEGTRFSV